ncbi:tRNA (cytosine(38)-C(5))-methyltransferase [Anguilla anguilla]|uniref:tRNA (cytosine(38)-C(5))-methyltransferase n=1 Tax=Anguilla anguilla TaxID=7936 RepID=UPI0015B142FE|nr:tRNA (cytosine(38)-C(5))-methyltransferase [Anguilla anguilla]XP_035269851.1 tRNA (cytosine(38)-C(5))-methyltransferase [Anguilla anguilla]
MEQLRVLELYSGIGGMHYALKECRVPARVVAAVDVNTTANEVYRHNFPATPLWAKTIEGLTLDDFNRLDFDMILMSPPCQPFTRIGLQGDVSDPRTKSFLYILVILPRLAKRPRFLLLENVKGFETSSARDALVKTLKDCGYSYQEFLLSPTCLGIPNSRLRYFLIARALPESFSFQTTTEVLVAFPEPKRGDSADHTPNSAPRHAPAPNSSEGRDEGRVLYKMETARDLEKKRCQDEDESVRRIQDFLEEEEEEKEEEGGAGRGMGQYLLPPKTLLRYALLMDIVRPSCRRSVCFTKGYGHYVEGTGSVLQSCTDAQVETAFAALDSLTDEQKLLQLSQLRLRYFSPREIANLMGFPSHFSFPENTTIKQRYRVLGNSLNVHVVARLIALMVG